VKVRRFDPADIFVKIVAVATPSQEDIPDAVAWTGGSDEL